MKVTVLPGKYVVAVSGGVDSMVLLAVLAKQPELELVVAHFDHGIRAESAKDREFVEKATQGYELSFVYEEGKLGSIASEEQAREARYAFLRRVQRATGAQAIITAHHQDDLLETVIFNYLRGANRRGMTPLQSSPALLRPFLPFAKQTIHSYAITHKLTWREDETNQDLRYSRNYIRHRILPRLDFAARERLLAVVSSLQQTNQELDEALHSYVHAQAGGLERRSFTALPHNVAREVMAAWLRENGLSNYDQKTLERLVVAAKTYQTGKRADILNKRYLLVGRDILALE